MLLIDANIALRYILNDDKEQAQRVKDIIDDNYIEIFHIKQRYCAGYNIMHQRILILWIAF